MRNEDRQGDKNAFDERFRIAATTSVNAGKTRKRGGTSNEIIVMYNDLKCLDSATSAEI